LAIEEEPEETPEQPKTSHEVTSEPEQPKNSHEVTSELEESRSPVMFRCVEDWIPDQANESEVLSLEAKSVGEVLKLNNGLMVVLADNQARVLVPSNHRESLVQWL
jgi:hypothetical protein